MSQSPGDPAAGRKKQCLLGRYERDPPRTRGFCAEPLADSAPVSSAAPPPPRTGPGSPALDPGAAGGAFPAGQLRPRVRLRYIVAPDHGLSREAAAALRSLSPAYRSAVFPQPGIPAARCPAARRCLSPARKPVFFPPPLLPPPALGPFVLSEEGCECRGAAFSIRDKRNEPACRVSAVPSARRERGAGFFIYLGEGASCYLLGAVFVNTAFVPHRKSGFGGISYAGILASALRE